MLIRVGKFDLETKNITYIDRNDEEGTQHIYFVGNDRREGLSLNPEETKEFWSIINGSKHTKGFGSFAVGKAKRK